MSVIGFQRDITDLFNYPSDENPTTQADYISAVKNWVETIKNLVDCNLWQPETEYSVGNYLRTPSLPPQYVLRCTASGISGTEEPDYTDVEIGDTIADGSIEWTIQTMASLNELDAYFAEIIQRIENGEGVVDTMWETDLETDIQPISATNVVPKLNGTGTLGTVNKKWANVYANGLTISGTATAVTPTAGDDSTKIATTEFVQDEIATNLQNYLPLTGGSITGNLSVSGTITGDVTGNADTATNATNDGNGDEISTTYLPLAGGTMTGDIAFLPHIMDSDWGNISHGTSSVTLYGVKGTIDSDKRISLTSFVTRDATDTDSDDGFSRYSCLETQINPSGDVSVALLCYKNEANVGTSTNLSISYNADGTKSAKFDGKDIEVVDKKVTSSTGYIRFASGFQICWGTVSGVTTSGTAVTLASPYENTSYRVYTSAAGYTVSAVGTGFSNRTTTGFKVTTGSSSGGAVDYLTVGFWK